jgi:hypothetical protein
LSWRDRVEMPTPDDARATVIAPNRAWRWAIAV